MKAGHGAAGSALTGVFAVMGCYRGRMVNRLHQPDTYFAPAPREPIEVIEMQAALVALQPLVLAALGPATELALVLNSCRQILAANRAALEAADAEDLSEILGKRPGEAFNCVHWREGPSGCGTGVACQSCGLVSTVLRAGRGDRVAEGEGRLVSGGERLDREFEVRASPLKVAGLELVAVTLRSRDG